MKPDNFKTKYTNGCTGHTLVFGGISPSNGDDKKGEKVKKGLSSTV